MKARTIEGWMHESELQWLATQAKKNKTIAEIGVWKGRSAACLAEHTKGKVYGIDHFHGNSASRTTKHRQATIDREGLILECKSNLREWIDSKKLELFIMSSEDASSFFIEKKMKFDMIFIDADHETKSVSQDIQLWLPLLQYNGILCGHDIDFPSVQKAVDSLLPNWKKCSNSIWCYKNLSLREDND